MCLIDSGLRRTHEDLAVNVAGGWNRHEGEGGWLAKLGACRCPTAPPRVCVHPYPCATVCCPQLCCAVCQPSPPPARTYARTHTAAQNPKLALLCRAVKKDGMQPAYGTAEYNDFSGGREPRQAEARPCAALQLASGSSGRERFAARPAGARARHALSCPLVPPVLLAPSAPPPATCRADTDGHGSHCAGSLAAAGDNGVGVAGVAWRASLYACKALSAPDAAGNAFLYDSATLDCYALCASVSAASGPSTAGRALRELCFWGCALCPGCPARCRQSHCCCAKCGAIPSAPPSMAAAPQPRSQPLPASPLQVGARVVSASYGGLAFSSLARDAIEELGRGGAVVVAAAGNGESNSDVVPGEALRGTWLPARMPA